VVSLELIGCLLVKRQPDGELLWGMIVEAEAFANPSLPATGIAAAAPATKHCWVNQGSVMWM
jgi:DNA-3-methyladenine glycosylase